MAKGYLYCATLTAAVSCFWIFTVSQCERHRIDANAKIGEKTCSVTTNDYACKKLGETP